MRRGLALFCCIALAVTALIGCGKKEENTFTVGFDAEFEPYGFLNEQGEYDGFDLDLAAEVCERRGWKLELTPIDWAAKDLELSGGTIDCIWNGFTITAERESQYAWTRPYVNNSQVFVVVADSGITNQASLAGKIVAVQRDSSALSALNDEEKPENIALRDSFGELIQYGDYNTAFMELEQGAVDAVAMDIGVAEAQIEERAAGVFIMLDEQLSTEKYGIGFKLGNESLRDQVQETLDEMAADGTFLKIAEQWGLQDSIIINE
jgi:polar amino acid transport system substrate-binding protein